MLLSNRTAITVLQDILALYGAESHAPAGRKPAPIPGDYSRYPSPP